MARMVYDEKLGKVVDKSPGRSIYLSNKQWAALTEYLDTEALWIDFEQAGAPEALKEAFTKLLRVGQEVCDNCGVEAEEE